MMSKNNHPWPYQSSGIPDDKFIRGDTPMTKEEIRALTISKLRINKNSIIYDIGAGTGSISIESALKARSGTVFAIERKKEGITLIRKNMNKFKLSNIKIIAGEAPEILEGLPLPDRVIIGGSGGKLKSIIKKIDKKLKPDGEIVLNAVTVNTLTEAFNYFKTYNYNFDICSVSISKNKNIAGYKMMKALNPVYIISARKKKEN